MMEMASWAGLVWRSNSPMKAALKWKPRGKRPLGRSKQRWIESKWRRI